MIDLLGYVADAFDEGRRRAAEDMDALLKRAEDEDVVPLCWVLPLEAEARMSLAVMRKATGSVEAWPMPVRRSGA